MNILQRQSYNTYLNDIGNLAVTDGNFIVGNGTTWVAESGNTARTSLGLGTGDSPTFAGLIINGASGNTLVVDTNTLVVDATNGRVGIGTTGPGYKLDVAGTGRFTGNVDIENGLDISGSSLTVSASNASAKFIDTSSGGDDYGVINNTAGTDIENFAIYNFTDLRAELSFDGTGDVLVLNGNVGINKTSPGAQLHVVSSAASTVGLRVDTAASPTADALQVTQNGTALFTVSKRAVRQTIYKGGLSDNVATNVFTITTPSSTGAFSCHVMGVINAKQPTSGAAFRAAAKSFSAHFARAQKSGVYGTNSSVTEISETASAATDPTEIDISTVTMTVVETSETVQTIQFQVDLTGTFAGTGDCDIVLTVELDYNGFSTPPTIAAA